MMKRIFPLLLLALFLNTQSYSQSLCFESIGSWDIQSIEEDNLYLWIGTNESGLIRYSKSTSEIIEFTTSNSLISSNHVRSLVFFPDLIISTDSGLYAFDDENFTLINDSISGELGIGNNGDMAIAANTYYYEYSFTEEAIVYQKDLYDLVDFTCSFCDRSTDMIKAENGDIWISHYGFYVFDILQYDGENWTAHNQSSDLDIPVESFNPLNSILEYDETIYASTGYVYAYEDSDWTVFHSNLNPIIGEGMDTLDLFVTDMEKDSELGYWMGTLSYSPFAPIPQLVYYNTDVWYIYDLPVSSDPAVNINKIKASTGDDYLLYLGTSNGLFIVDIFCLDFIDNVVDIDKKKDFFLYPNPSNGSFRFKSEIDAEIIVYTTQGKIAATYPKLKRNQLDLTSISKGLYFIMFISENGRFTMEVLIE